MSLVTKRAIDVVVSFVCHFDVAFATAISIQLVVKIPRLIVFPNPHRPSLLDFSKLSHPASIAQIPATLTHRLRSSIPESRSGSPPGPVQIGYGSDDMPPKPKCESMNFIQFLHSKYHPALQAWSLSCVSCARLYSYFSLNSREHLQTHNRRAVTAQPLTTNSLPCIYQPHSYKHTITPHDVRHK